MGPLFALLIIVMLSLLVVRVGTNALVLTGMSQEAARFQAASAFFGVGFTTNEAEMVMGHSVRRGVILKLIVAGNIGLTSAMATLIVGFAKEDTKEVSDWMRVFMIVLGIGAIAFLFNLKLIKKPVDAIMVRSLKSAGVVKAMDYELLLKVENGYSVSEITIHLEHPWCGKKLMESRPSDAGVVILNIHHADGGFTGAPDKDCVVIAGDELMIYGADSCVTKVANNLEDGAPFESLKGMKHG